jgi:hypothetical protein
MAAEYTRQTDAWLIKTGQYWKYLVSWVLVLLSALSFVLLVIDINRNDESSGRWAGMCIIAGAAAFTWLATTIRCRRCHHAVGWWYLTHSSAGDWLTDLRHRRECPVCGDNGLS